MYMSSLPPPPLLGMAVVPAIEDFVRPLRAPIYDTVDEEEEEEEHAAAAVLVQLAEAGDRAGLGERTNR